MKPQTRYILDMLIKTGWLLWAVTMFGLWQHSVAAAFFLFGAIQIASLIKKE